MRVDGSSMSAIWPDASLAITCWQPASTSDADALVVVHAAVHELNAQLVGAARRARSGRGCSPRAGGRARARRRTPRRRGPSSKLRWHGAMRSHSVVASRLFLSISTQYFSVRGYSPIRTASKRQLWPVLSEVAFTTSTGTGASSRVALSSNGLKPSFAPTGRTSRSRICTIPSGAARGAGASPKSGVSQAGR